MTQQEWFMREQALAMLMGAMPTGEYGWGAVPAPPSPIQKRTTVPTHMVAPSATHMVSSPYHPMAPIHMVGPSAPHPMTIARPMAPLGQFGRPIAPPPQFSRPMAPMAYNRPPPPPPQGYSAYNRPAPPPPPQGYSSYQQPLPPSPSYDSSQDTTDDTTIPFHHHHHHHHPFIPVPIPIPQTYSSVSVNTPTASDDGSYPLPPPSPVVYDDGSSDDDSGYDDSDFLPDDTSKVGFGLGVIIPMQAAQQSSDDQHPNNSFIEWFKSHFGGRCGWG